VSSILPPHLQSRYKSKSTAPSAGGGTPAGGGPVYQMPQPSVEEEGIRPRIRTTGLQFSLQDIVKALRGALSMTQQAPTAGAIAPPVLAGQRFVPLYNPALRRQMPDTRLALLRKTGLPQQTPTGTQPPAQPRLQPPTPYYGRSAIPGYAAPNQPMLPQPGVEEEGIRPRIRTTGPQFSLQDIIKALRDALAMAQQTGAQPPAQLRLQPMMSYYGHRPAPRPYEWTGAVTKEWGGPPKMGTVTWQSFWQSLPIAKWFNAEPERTAEVEQNKGFYGRWASLEKGKYGMTPADHADAARYSAAAAEWMADYARQLEDSLKKLKPAGRYGYWYPYWGWGWGWGWGGGGGGGGGWDWGGRSQRATYYYNPLMNWNI